MTYIFAFLLLALFTTNLVISEELDSSAFEFSRSNAKFATDFYSAIAGGNTKGNFIVSPFSVQICGAMLYAGAAGETANVMAQGLKFFQHNKTVVGNAFKKTIEKHTEKFMQIANKIYLAENITVKPKFQKIITEQFLSEEENIYFSKSEETAKIINNWVKNVTHDKIRKLFENDAFDKDVFMALVNTIYFKGDWETPFEKSRKGKFWVSENESKEVEMMHQEWFYNMDVIEELDATVLQFKYENSDISMLVILPKERSGLSELEHKLPNINLIELPNKLTERYSIIEFPKFKIEFSGDLKDIFTKMGMGSIFEDANFSNMIEGKTIKVDKAVHKAFIETTKQGTEAGAATGFMIGYQSLQTPFVADHPFIFAIVSKSAVLFMGRYVE